MLGLLDIPPGNNTHPSVITDIENPTIRSGIQPGGILTVIKDEAIPLTSPLEHTPLRFNHITSYNWLKTDRPTILLPGTTLYLIFG